MSMIIFCKHVILKINYPLFFHCSIFCSMLYLCDERKIYKVYEPVCEYMHLLRRRYRIASEGHSVAPWCPRFLIRLHRSAGGTPLSLRTWSIHLSRGRPGRHFHWSLGGRPRDRSTWQRRALCAETVSQCDSMKVADNFRDRRQASSRCDLIVSD